MIRKSIRHAASDGGVRGAEAFSSPRAASIPSLKMPIPDYETLMLPVLRFAADAQEHSMKELVPAIGSELRLTARSEGVLAERRHEIGTHRRADAGGVHDRLRTGRFDGRDLRDQETRFGLLRRGMTVPAPRTTSSLGIRPRSDWRQDTIHPCPLSRCARRPRAFRPLRSRVP